jgi:hypothetical protein
MNRTTLITHLLRHSCTPILSRLIEASNRSEQRELKMGRRRRGWAEVDERRARKRSQQTPAPSTGKLSPERSGTASVATTSPHAEFPDQSCGCLIRRSGNGGETKAAIMVDRWSVWWTCVFVRDFFVHKREGGRRREVCPNSKGSPVALWSQNFLSLA